MSNENAALPAAAANENIAELAAREQVKAPEGTSEVNAAEAATPRDPVRAPEQTSANAAMREPPPKPEQSTHHSAAMHQPAAVIPIMPQHSSNVVAPEAFVKAEQNIAAFLAMKLDPALSKGMQLTLSNVLSDSPEGRTGGTDLKLCFAGPSIEANFAEISRELIKSLVEHPTLKGLLKDNHTLVIEQADSPQKGQMLHLHLPNLTPEKYSQLINTLAATVPMVAPGKPNADEAVNASTAITDLPKTTTPPVIQPPEIRPVKEPVINEPTKAEAHNEAAAAVQAPVIKMETLKENPLGMTA